MHGQAFDEIVQFRRSNRKFNTAIQVPEDVIQRSLERAILSPNSSNMQLWEFHWIKSEEAVKKFAPLCMNQSAARTANHLVVFVTRQDKWKTRAKWNHDILAAGMKGKPTKREKSVLTYYGKLMPLVYGSDPFGILTLIRRSIGFFGGLTKPFVRMGGRSDQRVVVHKSCALAAQTFMLSIAAEGYHTCPMEGFDKNRVRRALKLPFNAEINMIIAIGKGTEEGVWGPRLRVPNEEVIHVW